MALEGANAQNNGEGGAVIHTSRDRKFATQHNSQLPISRLPVETLTYIFSFNMPSEVKRDQHREKGRACGDFAKNWLAPLLVCSHWKAIMEGCPRLWSTVILRAKGREPNTPRFRAMLRRSGNGGNLSLLANFDCTVDDDPREAHSHKLLVVSSADYFRLEKLHVHGCKAQLEDITQSLRGSFPQMKTLILVNQAYGAFSLHDDILLPSLRHLELSNVLDTWIPLCNSNITRLVIRGVYNAPAVRETMQLLSQLRKLQYLSLCSAVDVGANDIQSFSDIASQSIHLPEITTVEIYEEIALCHEVLRCVVAPPECITRVRYPFRDDTRSVEHTSFCDTIGGHVLPWLARISAGEAFCYISVEADYDFNLYVHPPSGGSPIFTLALRHVFKERPWDEILGPVLSAIRSAGACRAVLHLDAGSPPAALADAGVIFADALNSQRARTADEELAVTVLPSAFVARGGGPDNGRGSGHLELYVTSAHAEILCAGADAAFWDLPPVPVTKVTVDSAVGLSASFCRGVAHVFGAQAREVRLYGPHSLPLVRLLAEDGGAGPAFPALQTLVLAQADLDCAPSGGQVLFDVLQDVLAARLRTRRVDVLLLAGCCGVLKARLAALRRVADRILVLDDGQGIEYLDVDSLTTEDLEVMEYVY